MPKYNGHKNFAHWNVSLWLNNDESLYRMCKHMKQHYAKARMVFDERRSTFIARQVIRRLKDEGITHTPDGIKYSTSSVEAAMRDM